VKDFDQLDLTTIIDETRAIKNAAAAMDAMAIRKLKVRQRSSTTP
jgi:hypothetical protein